MLAVHDQFVTFHSCYVRIISSHIPIFDYVRVKSKFDMITVLKQGLMVLSK